MSGIFVKKYISPWPSHSVISTKPPWQFCAWPQLLKRDRVYILAQHSRNGGLLNANGSRIGEPSPRWHSLVTKQFFERALGYFVVKSCCRYRSTFSSVRRRGRRPIRRSSTKRGSPTARLPKRVADMCVSLRCNSMRSSSFMTNLESESACVLDLFLLGRLHRV